MSDRVVVVQLFAVARELAGEEQVELSLPAGATVGQLRQALLAAVPGLKRIGHHLLFAIDAEYASDGAIVPSGADIACIPPVSGG